MARTQASMRVQLQKEDEIVRSWLCQAWLRQNPTVDGPEGDYQVGHQRASSGSAWASRSGEHKACGIHQLPSTWNMKGDHRRTSCMEPHSSLQQGRTGPQLGPGLPRLYGQVLPGHLPADACQSTTDLCKMPGVSHDYLWPCRVITPHPGGAAGAVTPLSRRRSSLFLMLAWGSVSSWQEVHKGLECSKALDASVWKGLSPKSYRPCILIMIQGQDQHGRASRPVPSALA